MDFTNILRICHSKLYKKLQYFNLIILNILIFSKICILMMPMIDKVKSDNYFSVLNSEIFLFFLINN